MTNQKGAVNLDMVNSHDNKLHGAEIDNRKASFPVIMSNSAFRGNAAEPTWTNTNGLHILSIGSAAITGVVSSENFGDGLYIYANGITIRHSVFNGNKKRNGSYFGTDYYGSGIFGYTDPTGNILVEDVTANLNSYSGISLGSVGTFSLNRATANENGQDGFTIGSGSTMSIKDLTSNNNGHDGLSINCYKDTKQIPATLINIEVKRNGNKGIYIYASGAFSLTDFDILENGSGLDIYNDTGVFSSSVVNLTDGSVNFNKGFGIRIQSMGNVKLVDVSASRNDTTQRFLNLSGSYPGIYPDKLDSNIDEWKLTSFWPDDVSIKIEAGQEITATLFRQYLGAFVPLPGGQITGSEITFDHSIVLPSTEYKIQIDGSALSDPIFYNLQLIDPDSQWDNSEIYEFDLMYNYPCGLNIITLGSISISNGSFSGNGSAGIAVNSTTNNLSNISASGNGGNGFHVMFDHNLGAKPVTLTGFFNNFSDNGFDGVNIISSGVVSLGNLVASRNMRNGVFIDNNVGTGSVTVQHILPDPSQTPVTFNENGWSGLWIYSKGAVSIKDIRATGNGEYGAYINNCLYSDTLTKCTGSGNVSLLVNSGYDNTFENNQYSGLHIQSKGVITTYNIIANGNGVATESAGVILDNDWIGASSGVTVGSNSNHSNSFYNNGDSGLIIYSRGSVNVTRFQADQNFVNGFYISNEYAPTPQAVTLSYGQANENQNGSGLVVRSKGTITVTEVESNANDILAGTIIQGETLNEYLTDSRAEDGDYWYFTNDTEKNVFTIDVTSEFNADFSLWVRSGNDYTITSYTGSGTSWSPVISTLSAGDYFIKVTSQSTTGGRYTIALNDPEGIVSQSGGVGMSLTNNLYGGAGAIKITGKATGGSLISNNSSIGLIVDAKGAITITDIFANFNGSLGALINNASSSGAVSIGKTANEFCDNGSDGLKITANGAITLTNVDAYGNAGYGAILDNYQNPTGAVTINTSGISSNWYSSFSWNGRDGLVIRTKGIVTLKQVGAAENQGNGLIINNIDSPAKAAVSISNGFFSRNGQRGISVESKGAITLASVNANENEGDNGIYIHTEGTGATNLSKIQVNGNAVTGLYADSTFTITANALTATENGGSGVVLVSFYNPLTMVNGVTILSTLGSNKFYDNGKHPTIAEINYAGLKIESVKSILVNQIQSGNNYGQGINLYSMAGSIILNGGLAENNSLSGLRASTDSTTGDITISNFSAFSNGFNSTGPNTAGAILKSMRYIRLTNAAFHGNADYGVQFMFNLAYLPTWLNTTSFGNNLDDQGARNIKLN